MNKPYHLRECAACLAAHPALKQQLRFLDDSMIARKSHYLQGRYENIYPKSHALPALDGIAGKALEYGAAILRIVPASLKIGYWLNIMHCGDETLPHSHDDGDELLSGCYYLHVPPGSGRLILSIQGTSLDIVPREAWFVFFAPEVEHQVTRHGHTQPRISVGFNIGPRL